MNLINAYDINKEMIQVTLFPGLPIKTEIIQLNKDEIN